MCNDKESLPNQQFYHFLNRHFPQGSSNGGNRPTLVVENAPIRQPQSQSQSHFASMACMNQYSHYRTSHIQSINLQWNNNENNKSSDTVTDTNDGDDRVSDVHHWKRALQRLKSENEQRQESVSSSSPSSISSNSITVENVTNHNISTVNFDQTDENDNEESTSIQITERISMNDDDDDIGGDVGGGFDGINMDDDDDDVVGQEAEREEQRTIGIVGSMSTVLGSAQSMHVVPNGQMTTMSTIEHFNREPMNGSSSSSTILNDNSTPNQPVITNQPIRQEQRHMPTIAMGIHTTSTPHHPSHTQSNIPNHVQPHHAPTVQTPPLLPTMMTRSVTTTGAGTEANAILSPKPVAVKKFPTRDTKSSLSLSEQKEYLEMQRKMAENRELIPQITKSARFSDLHCRVLKEQQLYRQAMFDEAMMNMNNYRKVDIMIERQVRHHLDHLKQERIVNGSEVLPSTYHLCKSMDISEVRPVFRVDPILRLQRVLIRLGKCRHFRSHMFTNDFHFKLKADIFQNEVAPLMKSKDVVTTPDSSSAISDIDIVDVPVTTPSSDAASMEETSQLDLGKQIENSDNNQNNATSDSVDHVNDGGATSSGPTQPDSTADTTSSTTGSDQTLSKDQVPIWKKYNIPVVSSDPIISQFLLKRTTPTEFRSDTVFIMSSSTMQEVLDTHWPSLSEEWTIPVRIKTNDHGLKCIFLDKPLPDKSLNARERNALYYKAALKSFGLNTAKEAFVVDYNQEPPTQALLKDMATQLNQTESLSDIDTNVNYSMFDLGPSRIMVRYHTDGVVPDATPRRYKHIGIKPKLQYLGKKHPEEVTKREIARWWSHAYIRQDEELHVAHISVKNNSVIEMERIGTHSEIITKFGYEPSQAVKLLNMILTELRTLEPGFTYLVQHLRGDRSVKIWKDDSQQTQQQQQQHQPSYNLAEDFKEVGKLDDTIAYIPRKWRHQADRVPYTFPVVNKQQHKSKNNNSNNNGNHNNNKRKRERGQSRNKRAKQTTQQQQPATSSSSSNHFSAPIRPVIASSSGFSTNNT